MKTSSKKPIHAITGLTIDQLYMISECVDLIRDHTHFDEESGEYEVAAEDITRWFDKKEFDTLQSINILA
ncbi:hypothetical protein [uncultured Parabacteroides sp.]|jgi:hypothetical protein|uniref:hypothetical protein n=1 Tax=uncultured Parabacteroides sp. TaxID=512312 RepID=UPI0025D41982|nr:hypothetical protein [uncultured Parabacteroides sp.]